jgi:hypothetical protein
VTIYLYVKTHNKTGLKYLGKTTKDPHSYLGSGVDWKIHLKEHGEEHTTEIIRECQTNEELNHWGRHYSSLWNVADSPEWANRIPETGGGSCSIESAKKISATLLGRKKPPRTKEYRDNISKSCIGIPKPRSKEHQEAWIKSSKANWKENHERKTKVSEMGKSNKGRKHTPESSEKKRQSMQEYWRLKKSQSV